MRKKLVLVAVLVLTASWMSACYESVDKKAYYSVALTTSQLFFAKIQKVTESSLYLTDVFYLKKNPEAGKVAKKGEPAQPDLQLVPQTGDFHSPQNEMRVNRKHVLYYQPLREDSRIFKLIQQQPQAK